MNTADPPESADRFCPYCNTEIPAGAPLCPHCGLRPRGPGTEPGRKADIALGLTLGCIALPFLVFGGCSLLAGIPTARDPKSDELRIGPFLVVVGSIALVIAGLVTFFAIRHFRKK